MMQANGLLVENGDHSAAGISVFQAVAVGEGRPNRSDSTRARIWSSSGSGGGCQVACNAVKAAARPALTSSQARPASLAVMMTSQGPKVLPPMGPSLYPSGCRIRSQGVAPLYYHSHAQARGLSRTHLGTPPDPVSRENPDPWRDGDHLAHNVNESARGPDGAQIRGWPAQCTCPPLQPQA